MDNPIFLIPAIWSRPNEPQEAGLAFKKRAAGFIPVHVSWQVERSSQDALPNGEFFEIIQRGPKNKKHWHDDSGVPRCWMREDSSTKINNMKRTNKNSAAVVLFTIGGSPLGVFVIAVAVFFTNAGKAHNTGAHAASNGSQQEKKVEQDASESIKGTTAEADKWPGSKVIASAMLGFEVVHSDSQPSLTIGSHKAYRIVLRHGDKELVSAGQCNIRETGNLLYRHIELAAFTDSELTADERDKIDWQEWKDDLPYFKKAVHLGRGMGMDWYANATIYDQEKLRDSVKKFDGGDDRLTLLTEALLVDDKGKWTSNSCELLLAHAGDQAIPYIRKIVAEKKDGNRAIPALAFIQTRSATEYLQLLYASEATRKDAIYALIRTELRQSAKDQYFDMIRRRLRVIEPMQACVQFQWKDALPLISEVYLHPESLYEFEQAFEAKRQLEGRPIAEDFKKARDNLYSSASQEECDRIKDILLKSKDTEFAIVTAICLSVAGGKINSDDQERMQRMGRSVLRQLPRKLVEEIISRLSFELSPSMQPAAHELSKILLTEER